MISDLIDKIPSPERARQICAEARAGSKVALKRLKHLCENGKAEGLRQQSALEIICAGYSELRRGGER